MQHTKRDANTTAARAMTGRFKTVSFWSHIAGPLLTLPVLLVIERSDLDRALTIVENANTAQTP